MWEKASSVVYDMLVGHEVGHALYTPDEDWTLKVQIPPQFVNVVEDVRIEKMMKRRYPGISKTFTTGTINSLEMISLNLRMKTFPHSVLLTVSIFTSRLVVLLILYLKT